MEVITLQEVENQLYFACIEHIEHEFSNQEHLVEAKQLAHFVFLLYTAFLAKSNKNVQ